MVEETADQIFTGKNVEAAIEAGLAALGLRRDQVKVEVIHPGSRGLLGIGAQDARVRLIPIPQEPPPPPEEPAQEAPSVELAEPVVEREAAPPEAQEILAEASELLQGLLDHMGIRAKVRSYVGEKPDEQSEPPLILNIEGEDLGILIGRRGDTLAALQYIVRLMVNHRRRRWINIIVDVEEYKARRERQLRQLALRMAERVVRTGKPVRLEPMPARERRIIHLALRDHPHVTTQSVGEGERRRVTIRPR
ncbi:MAG TPA: protein jag [Caldilineae bacterium]|nr:protein jag [Caldilineae bacterium]